MNVEAKKLMTPVTSSINIKTVALFTCSSDCAMIVD